MNRRNELLSRARVVQIGFALLSLFILFRVFNVGILEREEWLAKRDVNLKLMPVYTERGNILADDEKLLSTSLQFYDAYCDVTVVDEQLFKDSVGVLAQRLNQVIGKRTKAQWERKLWNAKNKNKRYLSLSRNATIAQYNALKKFPIFNKGRYKGGFVATPLGKRVRPFGNLAKRTIGMYRDSNKVGLERYYDKQLTGEVIKILKKRVNVNTWIPVEDMNYLSPKRGDDIITTLNVNMQDIVHDELNKRLLELSADMGTAIVMEVETGAIKAMVNLSRVDDGSYHELKNIAVLERTDPGSTIKLASTMAMMEDGYINLDSKVNLNGGELKIYNRTLSDSKLHGIYETTVREAFEKSSNVGIGSLAFHHYQKQSGRERFINKFKQFGLGKISGIDLYGENPPYLKDPKNKKHNWSGVSIPWMAHGYEYLVTPLQLLKFYNTVANNGKMMKPYLVSGFIHENGDVTHVQPVVESDSIAKPSTIKMAHQLLRGTVVNGTGKRLLSDFVNISGKTGTAVTNYARAGQRKRYNASFAGFFPSEKPKYSMYIMIYNPKGAEFYGGNAVGPAYKTIAERIMSFDHEKIFATNQIKSFDMPESASGFATDFTKVMSFTDLPFEQNRKSNWVNIRPAERQMIVDKKSIKTPLVPSVIGMGARDAVYVLENLGLKVHLNGVGHVVEQSIEAGSKNTGQNIYIRLN